MRTASASRITDSWSRIRSSGLTNVPGVREEVLPGYVREVAPAIADRLALGRSLCCGILATRDINESWIRRRADVMAAPDFEVTVSEPSVRRGQVVDGRRQSADPILVSAPALPSWHCCPVWLPIRKISIEIPAGLAVDPVPVGRAGSWRESHARPPSSGTVSDGRSVRPGRP